MTEFVNKHIQVALAEGSILHGTLYTVDAENTNNLILVNKHASVREIGIFKGIQHM